jgi:hypothetical protein
MLPSIGFNLASSNYEGSRIAISEGSALVGSAEYEAAAVIPRGPWHSLPECKLGRFFSVSGQCEDGRLINVFTYPGEFLHEFRCLFPQMTALTKLHVSTTLASYGASLFHRVCKAVGSGHFFPGVAQTTVEARGGFCVKEPNLPTVTTCPNSNKLVGLHVDNWYRAPIGERSLAPRRICANFGWNDRFFLLVAVSVDDLASILAPKSITPIHRRNLTDVAREYLCNSPNHPIIRIRVRPGEAYVAPTENLVHDASSIDGCFPDVGCHVHIE